MFSRRRTLRNRHNRVSSFSARVEVTPGDIQISELGYRWACCQKNGNLHFDWK